MILNSGMATLLGLLPASMLGGGALVCGAITALRPGTAPWLYRAVGGLATVAAFTGSMFALVAMRPNHDGVGAVLFGGGLIVDRFSVYGTVVTCAVLLLTLLGSETYMRAAPQRAGAFCSLLLVAAAAATLLVSQREMAAFTAAMALLLTALVLLTAITKTSSLTAEAALRQLLVGGAAFATCLYGLVLIYAATGSTDLHQLALGYRPDGSRPSALLSAVGIAMVASGLLMTFAAPPFQQMVRHTIEVAPGAVAAFSATLSLVAGASVLLRFGVSGFGAANPRWTAPATVLAAAMMLAGGVLAVNAPTIRRLIADLALAQAGFLLLAMVGVGTGIDGAPIAGPTALLYMLPAGAAALAGTLLLAGVFDTAGLGVTRSAYRGVGRRAPATAAALALGLAALAGVPPFATFVGRVLVAETAVNNRVAWAAVLAAVALVLCAIAVSRWLIAFYAEDSNDPPFSVRTIPPIGRWTAWAAVALTLLVAAFAGPLISLAGGGATALH